MTMFWDEESQSIDRSVKNLHRLLIYYTVFEKLHCLKINLYIPYTPYNGMILLKEESEILKKMMCIIPLLLLFGCASADDTGADKKLEEKNTTLMMENAKLSKQLEDLKAELDKFKEEAEAREKELDEKLKETEKELDELYASTGAVDESEDLGRGIPTPGDPALPSPKPGTYVPTASEQERMEYLDPSEERYAYAKTDGSVLHVRDKPSKKGKILTSLTDGYEMRILAYSEDQLWCYIETTTYDGEAISGFISAEFTFVP